MDLMDLRGARSILPVDQVHGPRWTYAAMRSCSTANWLRSYVPASPSCDTRPDSTSHLTTRLNALHFVSVGSNALNQALHPMRPARASSPRRRFGVIAARATGA